MQVVPDYLEDYLDTERALFLLLFIGCLGLGYYAYSLSYERANLEQRLNEFLDNAPKYQQLRRKLLSGRPEIPDELQDNPLSFMERVVPEEFLTNLQPIDQEGEGGYQFQLRLEDKDIKKILDLVTTLERERLLTITEFTLIRKSLNSRKFHSVMKLRTLQ